MIQLSFFLNTIKRLQDLKRSEALKCKNCVDKYVTNSEIKTLNIA